MQIRKSLREEYANQIQNIKRNVYKESPDIGLSIIRKEVNNEFKRIAQKLDPPIDPSQYYKILDKLTSQRIIDFEKATVIERAIQLLDGASRIRDIGQISASVVIPVGLKLIESLKEIDIVCEKEK